MARKVSTALPEYVANPDTTPPPSDDLLDHLSFEHRQIERLWSQLQLAHLRNLEGEHRPGARYGGGGQPELSRQIVTLLAEHDAREVQQVYPAVGRVVGEELAEHALADHEEIRLLLDRIDGADPADEEVFHTFTTLMKRVTAHFEEEERIAFPMLRAVLSPQELAELGRPSTAATPPAADGGSDGEVIDLASAEREQAEAASSPKGGLVDRGRRLLRRR